MNKSPARMLGFVPRTPESVESLALHERLYHWTTDAVDRWKTRLLGVAEE
jgi:hypothetical protein